MAFAQLTYRESLRDIEALLDDGDEDVDRDGNPDLRLHRVLRRAVELLDPKMLLDPLEEEFHLGDPLRENAHTSSTCGRRKQMQRFANNQPIEFIRFLTGH